MRLSSLLLLLSVALAGCNLAPRYEQPQAPVPQQFPQAGAVYQPLPDEPLALPGWDAFFTDSSLKQTISMALDHNRDLRVALANVEQARALYRVEAAERLPTITGDAEMNAGRSATGTGTGDTSGVQRSYSVGLGVAAFELDLFGRVRNLSESALEQFFASQENRRAVLVSVISETANAYVSLAASKEQLRLAQEAVHLRERTLTLTQARQRAGVGSGLDTWQADSSYRQAQADVEVLLTETAQSENALQLLLGQPLPPHLLPAPLDGKPMTLTVLPGSMDTKLLLARPDVRAAEHQLIAEHANIGAARAAFFPTISLTTSIGTASTEISNLFAAGTKTWSFVPLVSVPLFDGGANRANLDYARASQRAALATYEQTIQTAFREVADALAQRGTIDRQLEAQSRLLHAATQAARIAEARYRAGSDTFLNLLTAQETLLTAQSGWAGALETRQLNSIDLYRSLGGGAL